jgi:16S rRNA (uracil1498-N3)-methyltransferase
VLAESGAVLADPAGDPLSTRVPTGPVVIGPEGGFDPSELDAAQQRGVGRVSLGDGVLRVETAAVVAAVLIGALHGTPS